MPVTITRRTRGGFAAAAVVALALSACSPSNGSDETSSSSSGSSSAVANGSSADPTSKSASPTPVPASSKGPAKNWPVPKMPDAAKEKSPEGAKAFTEYYFEVVEYATITNDPRPLQRITEKSCDFCEENLISPANVNRKNGTWNVGGAYKVRVSSTQLESSDQALAVFSFKQEELKAYTSDGKLYATQRSSAKPVVGSMSMTFNNGWHTSFINIAKS